MIGGLTDCLANHEAQTHNAGNDQFAPSNIILVILARPHVAMIAYKPLTAFR